MGDAKVHEKRIYWTGKLRESCEFVGVYRSKIREKWWFSWRERVGTNERACSTRALPFYAACPIEDSKGRLCRRLYVSSRWREERAEFSGVDRLLGPNR